MEGDTVDGDHVLLSWISTHALTWRATSACRLEILSWVRFLPTPSHGGRPPFPPYQIETGRHFYPRPHMEGDLPLPLISSHIRGFLPTPSHGGRRVTNTTNNLGGYFYPRPHMEGDMIVLSF